MTTMSGMAAFGAGFSHMMSHFAGPLVGGLAAITYGPGVYNSTNTYTKQGINEYRRLKRSARDHKTLLSSIAVVGSVTICTLHVQRARRRNMREVIPFGKPDPIGVHFWKGAHMYFRPSAEVPAAKQTVVSSTHTLNPDGSKTVSHLTTPCEEYNSLECAQYDNVPTRALRVPEFYGILGIKRGDNTMAEVCTFFRAGEFLVTAYHALFGDKTQVKCVSLDRLYIGRMCATGEPPIWVQLSSVLDGKTLKEAALFWDRPQVLKYSSDDMCALKIRSWAQVGVKRTPLKFNFDSSGSAKMFYVVDGLGCMAAAEFTTHPALSMFFGVSINRCYTVPGSSGALVLDESNRVVGMQIGWQQLDFDDRQATNLMVSASEIFAFCRDVLSLLPSLAAPGVLAAFYQAVVPESHSTLAVADALALPSAVYRPPAFEPPSRGEEVRYGKKEKAALRRARAGEFLASHPEYDLNTLGAIRYDDLMELVYGGGFDDTSIRGAGADRVRDEIEDLEQHMAVWGSRERADMVTAGVERRAKDRAAREPRLPPVVEGRGQRWSDEEAKTLDEAQIRILAMRDTQLAEARALYEQKVLKIEKNAEKASAEAAAKASVANLSVQQRIALKVLAKVQAGDSPLLPDVALARRKRIMEHSSGASQSSATPSVCLSDLLSLVKAAVKEELKPLSISPGKAGSSTHAGAPGLPVPSLLLPHCPVAPLSDVVDDCPPFIEESDDDEPLYGPATDVTSEPDPDLVLLPPLTPAKAVEPKLLPTFPPRGSEECAPLDGLRMFCSGVPAGEIEGKYTPVQKAAHLVYARQALNKTVKGGLQSKEHEELGFPPDLHTLFDKVQNVHHGLICDEALKALFLAEHNQARTIVTPIAEMLSDYIKTANVFELQKLRHHVKRDQLLDEPEFAELKQYVLAGGYEKVHDGESMMSAHDPAVAVATHKGNCNRIFSGSANAVGMTEDQMELVRQVTGVNHVSASTSARSKWILPPRTSTAIRDSLRAQLTQKKLDSKFPHVDQAQEDVFFSAYPDAAAFGPFHDGRSYCEAVEHILAEMDGTKSSGWSSHFVGGGKAGYQANPALTYHLTLQRLALICAYSATELALMTPEEMMLKGLSDPRVMFIKNEPHNDKKKLSKKWRLIWNLSLIDSVVQSLCHQIQNKADIALYQAGPGARASYYNATPSGVGIGHADEGIDLFGSYIDAMGADFVTSSDVSGWDISYTRRMWFMDAQRRVSCAHGQNSEGQGYSMDGNQVAGFSRLMYNMAILSSAHMMAFGSEVWQNNLFGNMGSGTPSTSASNSPGRSFLSFACDRMATISVGDDNLKGGTYTAAHFEMFKAYGSELRELKVSDLTKREPIEFTSHLYQKGTDGRWTARFMNFEKMVAALCLRYQDEKVPTIDVIRGCCFAIRHNEEELRQLAALCHVFGWPAFDGVFRESLASDTFMQDI